MSSPAVTFLVVPILTVLTVVGGFLAYIILRYAPIIGRIFEEKPLFLPLRLTLDADGETQRFVTEDGLELVGSYFHCKTSRRIGVLVFCHEFLSDRSSFKPYLNDLRERGYDIFTFDFRNHGRSQSDPRYSPLQWVTEHEVADLNAALTYLRSRPDRDPAGVGLFGVSRGGSTALIIAANDPSVWGVITDGAFPTSGTMLAYIRRWAEIYVVSSRFWRMMPRVVFRILAWAGRIRSEKRLNCRFPSVEAAVKRISPRPWLMIHGEKDAYIAPSIARALFALAKTPKSYWIVPKAKHNRCRQLDPVGYSERVLGFLREFAPRRELLVAQSAPDKEEPTRIFVEPAHPAINHSAGMAAQVSG